MVRCGYAIPVLVIWVSAKQVWPVPRHDHWKVISASALVQVGDVMPLILWVNSLLRELEDTPGQRYELYA